MAEPERRAAASIFAEDKPAPLTEEQAEFKRILYNKMNPRRRKFIDKIGYDNWDPFQAPKDPLDIRTESAGRTLQQLLAEFMAANGGKSRDQAWQAGAAECALGIIRKDGKYQGIFDFCLWYASLLEREGLIKPAAEPISNTKGQGRERKI